MENNKEAQPGLNVDLKDAEDIVCEKCGGIIFEEKMMIKKISKFITGTGKDSISPIPVIVCASCNNVNEMFKPQI